MANAKNIIGSNNIKGSNLTETKLKIINNICDIHKTDKNYYEIICIKEIENLPSILAFSNKYSLIASPLSFSKLEIHFSKAFNEEFTFSIKLPV